MRRSDFYFVVMFVTVNVDLFKNYFELYLKIMCLVVEIFGRMFFVVEYRLEDVIEVMGYVCEFDGEFAFGVE